MSSGGLHRPDAAAALPVPSSGGLPSCGRTEDGNGKGRALIAHYRRPVERPFLAAERDRTTILIGGLTRRHEEFIKAVFAGSGHQCEILPTPDYEAFQIGKEFGNNGQCSPAYFTAGSLIQYLKNLESEGLSRQEIAERYIFFTAGSCGPCRFGMYAAEYRLALRNAGFDGFRVLRFQQDDGIKQKAEEPGLRYTLDFGLGMLKGLYLADALNDMAHNIRPFEVNPGETDRVMDACVREICDHLRTYKVLDVHERMTDRRSAFLARHKTLRTTLNVLHKFREHLHGQAFREVLERCVERINGIELDRTRVKPLVKIIGEFWAQTTEGGGNYRMFEFLENEGAHVQPEAIGTWICYLLAHAVLQMHPRRGMDGQCVEPGRWNLGQRLANEISFQKKRALLWFGEWLYSDQYHRVISYLGGMAHRLVSQEKLIELANPFYDPLARGGEGYLEVGKNIYYTQHKLCHMVLSLKPFGCMPSSQSDGVQSAVVNRFKDMIFLPIETSGEGEVNAHSRAQMALGEAKAKAKAEFHEALSSTGRSIGEIREFAGRHPELRKPLYKVPHRPGVAGIAANFVLHVGDLMAGRARLAQN
jgi:predicted nucleotide-binding protein (sugar kinase/HSP70/actin superfamily)